MVSSIRSEYQCEDKKQVNVITKSSINSNLRLELLVYNYVDMSIE
jgi:hypothetical protein